MESPSFWSSFDCVSRFHCLSCIKRNTGQRSFDFAKDEVPGSTTFPPTNNFPPTDNSNSNNNNNNFPGSQGSFPSGSASPVVQTPPSPSTPSSSPVSGMGTGNGNGNGNANGNGNGNGNGNANANGNGSLHGAQTTPVGKVWCIAKPSVDEVTLMGNIVYACGEGGVNCAAIQPGGACFKPNSLTAHASFIMNLYYQRNQRNWWTCHFNNTGLVVFTDPSYGECIYSPQ